MTEDKVVRCSWHTNGTVVNQDGEYVLYSDYARLAGELETRTHERDKLAERVKAADSLLHDALDVISFK